MTFTEILLIGAVPVICFALGWLCAGGASNKSADPAQGYGPLRKGW
jgi:hypothetical protein